jgi:curved DNA-binding protein CbpA
LLDPSAVKKAYRKSLIAVHPDKQDAADVEAKVLAQQVFDALREAWNIFEKTG